MTDSTTSRPRVLCVDDDAFMLNILTRTIGGDYEVLTSPGGAEALQLIENSEPIQVVVSDHRMPGLSGAQFLETMRNRHPLTVRILLTGETDLVEAVSAMNQAGLFRFLLKPGTRPILLETLKAAVEQYQLQVAESELLQKTLIGSMGALSDVLAIANPTAFGHVSRIQELALAVATQMKLPELWPLEFASVAAQLGHITLPERTLRRLYAGEKLSPEENAQVTHSVQVAEGILNRIPRLGPVVAILASMATDGKAGTSQTSESIAADILRVVSAFAAMESTTASQPAAVTRLLAQAGRFNPEVLQVLTEMIDLEPAEGESIEVLIGRVRVGMIVAEDLCTRAGALLVPKGYRITESFVARLGYLNKELLPAVIRTRSRSV
jgi:response regulator RpfG family c-di-GMP phosphodiesterase